MSTTGSQKYWYNTRTGEVEFGFESPSIDRVGPFDSEVDAANAPATLRENSERWAREEAEENGSRN